MSNGGRVETCQVVEAVEGGHGLCPFYWKVDVRLPGRCKATCQVVEAVEGEHAPAVVGNRAHRRAHVLHLRYKRDNRLRA